MMHSNRSEYSRRRPNCDRSSRHWDDYEDKWEEPQRDKPQDPYQKYGGGGHGSREGTSSSREYSDSPKGLHSKDKFSVEQRLIEWSKKGSVRGHAPSPKKKRLTEDHEDDYRYRCEDKRIRQSPDSFPRADKTKDFKHTQSQEDDFRYRKTPQDSRQRYRHEEFTSRQQHEDCRQSSWYHQGRDARERSRDGSQERTRSQERSTKCYAKLRERNDAPSTDHEDYRQNRRFLLNGSGGKSVESDAASLEPKKSAAGFQRFLDVLNKGVKVSTLNKIVNQTSVEVANRPCSPTSHMNTDHLWSPSYTGRQQGSHQNTSHWSESEGSQKLAPSKPRHRPVSPKRRSLSVEKSLQRGDGEQTYISSNSRSRSPSVVEKTVLSPEDEHKHRQMLDVLEAIGMNLGSEELGQMSHRIHERLYGKKECDKGRPRKASRERDTRRAFSPRQKSRSSSSSRSSFSLLNQEQGKKDLYSAQGGETEIHQVQVRSSNSALQESEKCETYSQQSTAACQAYSQNSTYTLPEPSPAPVMPMYSPVNYSPMPYPPPPPNFPHLAPGLFVPRLPPFFPQPHGPPFGMFPSVLAQTRHPLPHYSNNPPSFNLPGMTPIQPLNTTQKPKTLSRPRCLQVIETKQPG